jgi:hypothetical protein
MVPDGVNGTFQTTHPTPGAPNVAQVNDTSSLPEVDSEVASHSARSSDSSHVLTAVVCAICGCLVIAMGLLVVHQRRRVRSNSTKIQFVHEGELASMSSSSSAASEASHAPGVCFLTDVEGNWEYFKVSPA